MKEVQDKVRKFVEDHNLEYKPEMRALDIVSEMGEMVKEILKMTNYGQKEPSYRKQIESEFGDVMFSLICLANTYNIEIEPVLDEVMKRYTKKIYLKGRGSSALK